MTEENAKRDAEILSQYVGRTIRLKIDKWDETRKVFRKFYSIKGISSIDVEFKPTPHVKFYFTDGTHANFFDIEQFEPIEGGEPEFGSIYARLVDEGFSF